MYPDTPRVEKELFEQPEQSGVTSWRVFRIMAEFVAGFDFLRGYGKSATFFGSARYTLEDSMYKEAETLAARLVKEHGFAVITGGGPGIMEAANKGAMEAGGQSAGLNITLEAEQKINPFVLESEKFYYFFTRKVMLAFASEVYIFFPGGFGTLDEFFEITTLVQTKKVHSIPIVLYGREYWEPLLTLIERQLYETYHTIDKEDMQLYHLVDSVEEARAYIAHAVR